jgi:hypothetical protein
VTGNPIGKYFCCLWIELGGKGMRPQKFMPQPRAVHATRCAGSRKEGVDQRINPLKRQGKGCRGKNDVRREKDRLPLMLGRHSGPCPNDRFVDLCSRKPTVRDRQKKGADTRWGRKSDCRSFSDPTHDLGPQALAMCRKIAASGLEGRKDACGTWD